MYSKTSMILLAVVALIAGGCPSVQARPKRSIIVASPTVAVASVPVVHAAPVATAAVVHHQPTSVVKTEQVRSGDHASYSYSHEVKSEPVVHHHHVAAPVVASTHHTVATAAAVPAYHYAAYYPSYTHSYAYSPYSYVLGK